MGYQRSGGAETHQRIVGGQHRQRIEAYGTIYPMGRTVESVEQQVEDALTRLGLRNIKFAADPWWMDDLDLTSQLLQAARRVLGPDRGMIVDAALSYQTAEEGLKLLPVLREAGILFLEAPLPLVGGPCTNGCCRYSSRSGRPGPHARF